jgi:hypothetical protein
MKQIISNLISAMQHMPVIDGHEHLPPEKEILSTPADVFTRLYCCWRTGEGE